MSACPDMTLSATPATRNGPKENSMQSALIITGISGAEHCAASLSKQLGLPVDVAPSRREGMAALRRREYTIVVIDEPVAESSPEAADLLWRSISPSPAPIA